jgi:DNA polymerase III subunit gamma/tau
MSVFHLKYRPQKFSDLDLVEVSKSLKKILSGKEIPQSFLFAGPKGAGKTSAARILARAVNCSDLKNGEPCGKCDNCQEILRGSSIDVIEIDAASNRGIEDVRALKDKAYLLPSKLSKKVFIVDEVHMLTKEAFNALLKLIEEPPVHTIFVLCTTDEGKIPETVLSRLIKVGFHKGNKEELKGSLKRVIDGEGVEVEEGAVDLIVSKSDGSFRNLQKTFNEIFLEFGKKISKKEAIKFFEGRTGEYTAEEIEDDLAVGEVKIILMKLEKMAEAGVDFKAFREELIDYFQNKLLGIYGVEGKGTSKMGAGEVEKWLGLLIAAGKQEKDITIDQLPLELAVVELLKNKKPVVRAEKSEEKEPEEVKKEAKNINLAVEMVEQEWGKVLMAVKPFNHSVEAFLRAARPTKIKGDRVVLEVFYPFHKDKLEEPKNREIVEKGLNLVFGVEMSFECVLSRSKGKPLVINNDTPVEKVSEKLSEEKLTEGGDIYDVAKQIFG